MMPYKENLKKASALKKELDTFRPLTPEVEKRITQKFRLDWNYHSSRIEGNTLTYGETKALILFGSTAQAKPLKDHLEMAGHDEAIKYVEEVVKQERPLTETFIRELHKMILKEPYEVDAITPDGKPTKKMVSIGTYKTVPNHVETKTGEIFYFASPEETPAKMGDLIQWYKENKDSPKVHPVLLATEFHYRFVRIHPFDDGNGRIARLLMNFILMQKGYPPAIIKTEDKNNYFLALQQADAGQLAFFFNYICEQVIHALALMIRGAKGENIDDDDDLDKKLALLRQEIETEDPENEIKTRLTPEVIKDALSSWGYTFLNKLVQTTAKFNEFYDNPKHRLSLYLENEGVEVDCKTDIDFAKIDEALNKEALTKGINRARISFQTDFGAYKKGGLHPFGCVYTLEIQFEMYNYEVHVGYLNLEAKKQTTKRSAAQLYTKKLLHQPLSSEEIKEINRQWGNTLFQHLEYHRKKNIGNGKK